MSTATAFPVVPPPVQRKRAVVQRAAAVTRQQREFLDGLAAHLEQTRSEAAAVAEVSLAKRFAQAAQAAARR